MLENKGEMQQRSGPSSGPHSRDKKVLPKHQQGPHSRAVQDLVTCILDGASTEVQSLVLIDQRPAESETAATNGQFPKMLLLKVPIRERTSADRTERVRFCYHGSQLCFGAED